MLKYNLATECKNCYTLNVKIADLLVALALLRAQFKHWKEINIKESDALCKLGYLIVWR